MMVVWLHQTNFKAQMNFAFLPSYSTMTYHLLDLSPTSANCQTPLKYCTMKIAPSSAGTMNSLVTCAGPHHMRDSCGSHGHLWVPWTPAGPVGHLRLLWTPAGPVGHLRLPWTPAGPADSCESCGQLWDTCGWCGHLRVLWTAADPVDSCGTPAGPVDSCGSCGQLWDIFRSCGQLWDTCRSCGQLWDICTPVDTCRPC